MKYSNLRLSKWLIGVICILIGAFLVIGSRFITYKTNKIHYHANFALYINGKREEFKEDKYYSEIQMCSIDSVITPIERAHMHDNVNDVVHVEGYAVTWNHFFSNLGWYLGPTFIMNNDGVLFTENKNSKLHIILNGQDFTDLGGISNRVINDKDRLLISYGNISKVELNKQFNDVSSTAQKYDETKDPKSCGSNSNSGLIERIKYSI